MTATLSVSAATLAAGHEQAEHITVAVKPLSGGTPTGTVTVTAGQKDLCAITLGHGSGGCSLRAGQLPQGSDRVEVTITAGSASLCVITLAKGKGGCTLASRKLRPGRYHLTAAYPGSSNSGLPSRRERR